MAVGELIPPQRGSELTDEHDARTIYVVYKRRHAMLFVYFVAVFTCGAYQNSFAPISDIYEKAFRTSTAGVSMFANVVPLMNIFVSFFSPVVYEQRGLRFGCVLGALLMLAGGWTRYAGSLLPQGTRSWIIFLGQSLMATGYPLLLAAGPLLSNAWYGSEGRAIAIAVASLAGVIGSVAASVVAPMFFPPLSAGESRRSQLEAFLMAEAVLGTASFAGMLLLRSAPPTPPAPKKAWSSDSQGGLSRSSVREALRDRSFQLLMLVFGCGYGSLNTLTTLINEILRPTGFSDDDIGNIGSGMGAGILGAFVFGAIADTTKEFSKISKLCGVFSLFGNAGFLACCCFQKTSMWLPFAALGWMSFFALPVCPLVMEMGVEVLFPLPESVVGCLIWAAGNGVSLVAVLVGANMRWGDGRLRMLPCALFLSVLFLVCVVGMLFFKGEMKRTRFEDDQQRARQAALQGQSLQQAMQGSPAALPDGGSFTDSAASLLATSYLRPTAGARGTGAA